MNPPFNRPSVSNHHRGGIRRSGPQQRLFSLLILALLMLTGCSPASDATSRLTYGLTLAPSGIDPHLHASSELTIPLRSVYDTLVYEDPVGGGFVPGLAESWTISSDGLMYTFDLRADVSFHDGTPFDAQAVKDNIDYIMDPNNHSFKAVFMLGPLQQVEVVDEDTVVFQLSEPFAPLMDSLSQSYLGIASPTALAEWGATEYQFHQVGTGPYRFVEYIPNDHITLEASPDYAWGPSFFTQETAQIDEIVFRFYEDEATRALALESGEVDIIGEMPPHEVTRLIADDSFTLHAVPIPGQPLQFLFNTQRSPTDDVMVRTALIMAVDRVSLVNTLFSSYSPMAQGPLCACTFGFSPEFTFPTHDLETAVDLLDDAGWIDPDGDGIRSLNGDDLELLLVAPPWGSNTEAAQLLAAAWEAIGARVTIEVAPGFGRLKEAQTAGEYNAIGFNLFGADPDLLRSFYSSIGLYNWTGYNDPTLDAFLLQAAQEWSDRAKRQDIYAQIAEILRDEALLIPLRDYVNLTMTNNRVQGLRFSAQGWSPFLIETQLEP